MEEDMDAYLALTNPEASAWTPELRGQAQKLRMFSVRQPFPLIVAGHRHLNAADFATLLKACVTISFRYNVIGSQPTNEQERVYYAAAQNCRMRKLITISGAGGPQTCLPADEAFRSAFADKIIRTTNSRNLRIVRYILCALERQLNNTDHDFESDTFNVEHVLPQNPGEGWPAFSDEEVEAMAYRIGNMALSWPRVPTRTYNAAFAVKKPVLAASAFELTRKVAEDNADWTRAHRSAAKTWLAWPLPCGEWPSYLIDPMARQN